MRSGSNPSNTSRKRARLFRITRHERPAWKPSSTSLANNSRSPCRGTPHSSSWYASINGSASSRAQQRRFMAPEFCMDNGPPASIRAMRFLQVTERDGRYVASLAETERPVPREGEVLVRVAGASGVGLARIQLGRLVGARVAATTRTSEKLAALERAGAELAIDTGRHAFAEQIEGRWGRDAVDVVLDPIGGPSLEGDVRVLATGGRVVFIATMAGARAEIDLAVVMRKRVRLVGSTLRARSRAEKGEIVARFRREILPA